MNTKVAIVKGSKNPQQEEIRTMLDKALDLIGGRNPRVFETNGFLLLQE